MRLPCFAQKIIFQRVESLDKFGEFALVDKRAVAHEGDVGANFFHFVKQVAGDEDGLTFFGQAFDDLACIGNAVGVEAVGGFIEDEELRIA